MPAKTYPHNMPCLTGEILDRKACYCLLCLMSGCLTVCIFRAAGSELTSSPISE